MVKRSLKIQSVK